MNTPHVKAEGIETGKGLVAGTTSPGRLRVLHELKLILFLIRHRVIIATTAAAVKWLIFLFDRADKTGVRFGTMLDQRESPLVRFGVALAG